MKKNFLLLLLFSAATFIVHSQPLIYTPNDSAEVFANVTDEFEPTDVHIKLINNTGDSASVTWGMINYSAPALWEVKLCDNNNCYDLLLAPGPYESLPVAVGDTIDMKFQYTNKAITGTGNTNVYAYVTGDSANSVVVLNYKANLTYVSGIGDNFSFANLKLYPNPTQRTFVVSGLENTKDLSFEVYDVIGAVMKTSVVNAANSQIEISVENLPAGEYILKALDNSGKTIGTSKLNKVD